MSKSLIILVFWNILKFEKNTFTFVTKYDSVVIGMKSVKANTNCNLANLKECTENEQCITGNCDAASGLCQPVP